MGYAAQSIRLSGDTPDVRRVAPAISYAGAAPGYLAIRQAYKFLSLLELFTAGIAEVSADKGFRIMRGFFHGHAA